MDTLDLNSFGLSAIRSPWQRRPIFQEAVRGSSVNSRATWRRCAFREPCTLAGKTGIRSAPRPARRENKAAVVLWWALSCVSLTGYLLSLLVI
jgi:hypothetical protein